MLVYTDMYFTISSLLSNLLGILVRGMGEHSSFDGNCEDSVNVSVVTPEKGEFSSKFICLNFLSRIDNLVSSFLEPDFLVLCFLKEVARGFSLT